MPDTPTTATIVIRPARSDEIEALAQIWYRQEVEGDENPPPFGGLSLFRHMFAHEHLAAVAEDQGRLVGFALTVLRDPVAFLSKLFVDPAYQSRGIGKRLLQAVRPDKRFVFCTYSSTDRRAHTLYVWAGMTPRWTHYNVRVQSERLASLAGYSQGIQLHEASPSEWTEIESWDAGISGIKRPYDHAFWRDANEARAFWFRRGDATLGYVVVRMRNEEALYAPFVPRIGPLGVADPSDAAACVCAAVEWARAENAVIRLDLAGTHPGLPFLIQAGATILYPETFLCDSAQPPIDPACYLPSGASLF